MRAPRSRGYGEEAFVTVLGPGVAGSPQGSRVGGYGLGGKAMGLGAGDGESKVTLWPEVEC